MNGREDLGSVIVYEECSNIPCEVHDKDIVEYGHRLGVDPTGDQILCAIIRGWILQPLPHYWFPCHDVLSQNWFYFNSLTGQSSWKHPLEDIHATLVKEYLRKRESRSTVFSEHRSDSDVLERGNPEGESAEPSMESGSPKLPAATLLAPIGPTKNSLPRTLAPLRRTPKLSESANADQSSPLKTNALSIQPNSFLSQQSARESTTGAKPRELVFPYTSSVPKVETSLFLDTVSLPTSAPSASSSPLSSSHSNQIAESAVSASNTKPSSPPARSVQLSNIFQNTTTSPNQIKESIQLSGSGDSHTKNNRSFPVSTNLSFTERLAAKKASRNKLSETKTSDTSRTIEATSLTTSDKKRVQFSLGSRDVRNYTPECSDENNGVEDESSEDILELLGDPQHLLAADSSDMHTHKFEEKRWDVGLSSFVGGSNSNSPAHKITLQINSRPAGLISVPDDEEEAQSPISEMMTHFTSRYETQTFRISNDEAPAIATSSPILPDTTASGDEKSEIQLNPPEQVAPIHPPSDDVDKLLFIASKKDHSFGERKAPLIPQLTDRIHEPEPVPGSNEEANASQDSLGMISSVPHSLKDWTPVFSENQECSIFEVDLKNRVFSEAAIVGPSHLPRAEPNIVNLKTNENSKCSRSSPSNRDEADIASISSLQPVGSVPNIVLSPAIDVNEPSAERTFQSRDDAYRSALEEMEKMKHEMETKLENEKLRLEQWFRDQIAQMKRDFEEELVSERRLCSDLLDREKDKMAASVVQMIERARGEKEDAARREIQQMEERFAQLLLEKKHQIQTLLQDGDTNEVKNPPAIHRLQDAAIQTENLRQSLSAPVHTITAPSFCTTKKTEVKNGEKENESVETDSTTTFSTNEGQKTAPVSNPCQCKNLQKQIANMEKEMEFLKIRNSGKAFRKNPTVKRSSKIPVRVIRDDRWVDDSDESTSTVSSSVTTSDFPRFQRGRSQSLTDLHATKDLLSTPVHRARRILSRNRIRKQAWMEDVSPTDLSSVETYTSSGVTGSPSPVSNFEWENVLHSIQKISGDLRQVWSHIGEGPISPHQSLRSTSYAPRSKSPLLASSSYLPWLSLENPPFHRTPLRWPLTGSTAERTQALRQWLQQNNSKSHLA